MSVVVHAGPWHRASRAVARAVAAAMPAALAQAIRDRHFDQGRPRLSGMILRLLRLRPLASLPAVFAVPDAPDRRMARSDSVVCAVVYWLGQDAYEGPELALWRLFSGLADHVVEIGANVGLYTMNGGLALKPQATYVAVEPHPVSHSALTATLAANDLGRVRVEQAAVVADGSYTSVTLRIPKMDRYAAPAGAHVATANPVYGANTTDDAQDITVRALPVGDVIANADLIKIDVEGLESMLLEASMAILRVRRPTIFLEVLADNRPLIDLVARLRAEGVYHVYRIDDDGVTAIEVTQGQGDLGGALRDVILSALAPDAMRALTAPAFRTSAS